MSGRWTETSGREMLIKYCCSRLYVDWLTWDPDLIQCSQIDLYMYESLVGFSLIIPWCDVKNQTPVLEILRVEHNEFRLHQCMSLCSVRMFVWLYQSYCPVLKQNAGCKIYLLQMLVVAMGGREKQSTIASRAGASEHMVHMMLSYLVSAHHCCTILTSTSTW